MLRKHTLAKLSKTNALLFSQSSHGALKRIKITYLPNENTKLFATNNTEKSSIEKDFPKSPVRESATLKPEIPKAAFFMKQQPHQPQQPAATPKPFSEKVPWRIRTVPPSIMIFGLGLSFPCYYVFFQMTNMKLNEITVEGAELVSALMQHQIILSSIMIAVFGALHVGLSFGYKNQEVMSASTPKVYTGAATPAEMQPQDDYVAGSGVGWIRLVWLAICIVTAWACINTNYTSAGLVLSGAMVVLLALDYVACSMGMAPRYFFAFKLFATAGMLVSTLYATFFYATYSSLARIENIKLKASLSSKTSSIAKTTPAEQK